MQVAAIIYGAASGSFRRLVVAEDLDRLSPATVLEKGEDLIILPPDGLVKNGLPDHARCVGLIAKKVGFEPQDARCVVLDGDLAVVGECMADPLIDAHKDGEIVRDKVASVGDVLKEDGKFYRETDDGGIAAVEEVSAEAVKR